MKTAKVRLSAGMGMVLAAVGTPALAGISQAVMFRNIQYNQTGNGNAISFNSAFLTLRLYATDADEYTTVQAFYGGPASPIALGQVDPTTYEFNTGAYNTRAAMDSDFPMGTYSLTANNPATSDNATTMFDYSFDAYSQSQPYLAGTSYGDLNGMNPAAPFTVQFSPFVNDAQATDPELFFSISDAITGDVVFADEFQPATTTGVTLPADTLMPNHAYSFDLDFSDRLTVTSNGADFPALLGFETRTDGSFVTGDVPEPATATTLAGLGAATLLTRRQSRRHARACERE